MLTAFDVSKYIISLAEQIGEPVTNMKLQKLLYYSYAWFLVEFNERLFSEEIQAWQYGPVVPLVYSKYKTYGADNIRQSEDGDDSSMSAAAMGLIEEVFELYGNKTAVELMRLSHSEAPWRDTFEEGKKIAIPDDKIKDFFKKKKQNDQN